MPDLESRFRPIREARSPDLWSEIEHRQSRPGRADPVSVRSPRIVLSAFLVAVIGFAFLLYRFQLGPRTVSAPTGPVPSTSNGDLYYVVGGGGDAPEIASIHPDGTGRTIALRSTDAVHHHRIAFSSDGARIAFADDVGGRSALATASADGSDVVRLTHGMNDSWPSWSSDGSKIAFSGTEFDPSAPRCGLGVDIDCPTDIYVMNADGSDLERITTDQAPDFHPVWSPDGTKIAFTGRGQNNGTSIWVVEVNGTGARQVSSGSVGSAFSPTWSPDGSVIAFAAISGDGTAIYGVAPDGTDEHLTPTGVSISDPVWSPDGSLIAFSAVDPPSGIPSLYSVRLDGRDVVLLATDPHGGIAGDITWRPVPVPTSTAPSR